MKPKDIYIKVALFICCIGLKKVKTMKHGMHNNSKTMKKKLKEWHDQLI